MSVRSVSEVPELLKQAVVERQPESAADDLSRINNRQAAPGSERGSPFRDVPRDNCIPASPSPRGNDWHGPAAMKPITLLTRLQRR